MLNIAFSRGYGTSPNATTKFHLPLTLKPSKSPLMRWCDDIFQQIHSGCWCSHVSCSCFKQVVWHTNINHWTWHETLVVMIPRYPIFNGSNKSSFGKFILWPHDHWIGTNWGKQFTHPRKLTWNLKMKPWKRRFLWVQVLAHLHWHLTRRKTNRRITWMKGNPWGGSHI